MAKRPKTTSNADANANRPRSFTTGTGGMIRRLKQSSSGKSIPEENSSAGGGQRNPSRKALMRNHGPTYPPVYENKDQQVVRTSVFQGPRNTRFFERGRSRSSRLNPTSNTAENADELADEGNEKEH